MRIHEPLDDIIGGKTSVRVLRALSLFPEKEFTGRQLAAAAQSAPSMVIEELGRFRSQGIVTRKTFGRTHAWKANPRHAIFRILAPAFEEEHKLAMKLLEELRLGTQDARISRAILFGSFARGDENPTSDVDLLVLTKRAADVESVRVALDALAIRLSDVFGLRLSPIIHAAKEFPALQKTPLFRRIQDEGRTVRGEPL